MYDFICVKDILQKKIKDILISENHVKVSVNVSQEAYYSVKYKNFQTQIMVCYQKERKVFTNGFIYPEALSQLMNLDLIKNIGSDFRKCIIP